MSAANQTTLKIRTHTDQFNTFWIGLMTGDCRLVTIFIAVITRERFAAFASIQRQQASLPPAQNVNSAPFSLAPARHFSGSIAKYARNAVTTAIFATF